jgi:hypothetical protein
LTVVESLTIPETVQHLSEGEWSNRAVESLILASLIRDGMPDNGSQTVIKIDSSPDLPVIIVSRLDLQIEQGSAIALTRNDLGNSRLKPRGRMSLQSVLDD